MFLAHDFDAFALVFFQQYSTCNHDRRAGCKDQIVLYEYQEKRSASSPIRFLEGFHGYLHTDGYAAYKSLAGTVIVGCLAHARRYFYDAVQVLSKEELERSIANEGLMRLERILLTDKALKDLDPDERKNRRLKRDQASFGRALSVGKYAECAAKIQTWEWTDISEKSEAVYLQCPPGRETGNDDQSR